MYLIRAEANFEDPAADIGPNSPTQDINVVRDRAQAPLYAVLVDRNADQGRALSGTVLGRFPFS